MKKIVILILILISNISFSEDIGEYKKRIKEENIKTFYKNHLIHSYSFEDIINSLIGVSGSVPIGNIRAFVNQNKVNRELKESEIDACPTRECIDAILGVMKH